MFCPAFGGFLLVFPRHLTSATAEELVTPTSLGAPRHNVNMVNYWSFMAAACVSEFFLGRFGRRSTKADYQWPNSHLQRPTAAEVILTLTRDDYREMFSFLRTDEISLLPNYTPRQNRVIAENPNLEAWNKVEK